MCSPVSWKGRCSPRRWPIAVVLRKGCLVLIGLASLLAYWGRRGTFSTRGPTAAEKTPEVPRTAERHGVAVGALTNGEGEGGDGNGVVPTDVTGALVELELPRHFDGALALKSERIVYCPIQKVACTEWIKVFRWIDGHEDWAEPRHQKHGLDVLEKMDVQRGNQILNSPDWLKFAVVREPAQRLLSCFLQKCNRYNMENEYSNCPYLELWPDLFDRERFPDGVPTRPDVDTLAVVWEAFTSRGKDSMFALYVDVITRRIKQDPCGQNKHWSPQYCHCSLDVTAPVFRIVGWANMTEAASAAIVPFASSPTRGLEIKEFLLDRMDTNHERHGKKTSAGSRSQEAYTAEALQAVHEAYAKDYELFSQYWDENN